MKIRKIGNKKNPSSGIYCDMPNDLYHASKGISSTQVKTIISETPFHYWAKYIAPPEQRIANDPTPAMLFGTGCHTAILEPHLFREEYVVAPTDINKRTKEGKEEYAAWEKSVEGKQVVKQEFINDVAAMAEAFRANKTGQQLVSRGLNEHSIYATCPETGLLIKCRPDVWIPDIGVVADYKTALSASPSAFSKVIDNLGYHISAAFYLDIIEQATGEKPTQWAFIVQEKKAPYASATYVLSDEALEQGRALYKKALRMIAECMDNDSWESYEEISEIDLPAWAYKESA